jgi:hypothetical protein
MLELARQWRDSGMHARAFAKERGVTPWVLYYWRQRLTGLDRPRRRRSARRASLARVRVVPDAHETGDLEILLVSGDRVRMTASVSVETLRRVVQALRSGC